jgi:general secretion pathway protein G
MFESDIGSYPSTQQGLDALIRKPEGSENWRGPYIKKSNRFEDPWRNEYNYQFPGQQNTFGYDLISPGPDGQLGTDDDISNFDEEEQGRHR